MLRLPRKLCSACPHAPRLLVHVLGGELQSKAYGVHNAGRNSDPRLDAMLIFIKCLFLGIIHRQMPGIADDSPWAQNEKGRSRPAFHQSAGKADAPFVAFGLLQRLVRRGVRRSAVPLDLILDRKGSKSIVFSWCLRIYKTTCEFSTLVLPLGAMLSKCTCGPWNGSRRSEFVILNCRASSAGRKTPGAISPYPGPR